MGHLKHSMRRGKVDSFFIQEISYSLKNLFRICQNRRFNQIAKLTNTFTQIGIYFQNPLALLP